MAFTCISQIMKNLCDEVGVVVIGRNEGLRLQKCITSILNQNYNLVYVDSGSSDSSAEYVESLGVDVLRLDTNTPFSAARARNEGFHLLNNKINGLKYIQFIDGDCECCEGWLSYASTCLKNNTSYALVSGRRKEKFPEKSIYNLLCDIEWNTPIGEAKACGGDFMIRKTAFVQVGGFNNNVVSGEEPEMCYRLRNNNWSIFRLDHPMTMHDAAITHFSQWWKRCLRAGHAYAQGLWLHLYDGKGYCVKESARIWFWAFIFPSSVSILTILVNPLFTFLFTAYPIQFARIALRSYLVYKKMKFSLIYSFFVIIGKWPEFVGQLLFYKKKLLKRKHTIIEYN